MSGGERAGLRFTGHALVDVGVAGLCAFAKKTAAEELTLEDLDRASEMMIEDYYGGKLNSYLTCVFMNASFVQPKESAEKTNAFKSQYLRAHRASPHPVVAEQRCVFSGAAATSPLVRTHFPLFSGEDVLNFRPNGASWVPAAGAFVVAVMFVPLASRRSEGSLLAVHTDEPQTMHAFARLHLERNRKLLHLPLPETRALVHEGYEGELPMWDAQKKRYKFADVKGPRSFVVHELSDILRQARDEDLGRPAPLTAYLVSNSGQGPSLDIFRVPSGVVSFVARATSAPTASAWREITGRFRAVADKGDDDDAKPIAKKRASKVAPTPGRAGWSRNPAFEELCDIFDAGFTDRGRAATWLRAHVLGRMEVRSGQTKYRDSSARSWALAALFLMEVLGMNKGRIEAIKSFADKLAEWIHKKTDKRLFNALLYERRLHDVQERLRHVQKESASGETLLFGLEEFRDVWLHEDGDAFLVRDLICIRVVEKLHELGYFREHPEDTLGKDEEDSTREATA